MRGSLINQVYRFFLPLIVLVWHFFFPLVFTLLYSDEDKQQTRTGWSPPSSSYLNTGLHFDTYAKWQFTCTYYRSTDKHKSFGWHTRTWWCSWLGKRFFIITNCILIVQTPYLSYRLKLILQVDYTMILVVYLFLHTHREDSALVNEIPEESNQFRFLRTMVTLKDQWGWFWWKLQPWGLIYLLTCHPVLLSLWHDLFVGDVLFHFYLLPLFLLLGVLPKWHMRGSLIY